MRRVHTARWVVGHASHAVLAILAPTPLYLQFLVQLVQLLRQLVLLVVQHVLLVMPVLLPAHLQLLALLASMFAIIQLAFLALLVPTALLEVLLPHLVHWVLILPQAKLHVHHASQELIAQKGVHLHMLVYLGFTVLQVLPHAQCVLQVMHVQVSAILLRSELVHQDHIVLVELQHAHHAQQEACVPQRPQQTLCFAL